MSGLNNAVEPFSGATDRANQQRPHRLCLGAPRVVYHITIHGHANEPRVALMMAAFIKRVTSR